MVIFIIGAGLLFLVLLAAFYAYRVAFYVPPSYRENIYDLPVGEAFERNHEAMRKCIDRLSGLPYESVSITSFDGKKLFGRYYHTRDGAPLQIQFHGYRGSAMRDFCGGTPFAGRMGHNALVVDQRSHGRSEGHTIAFGILERYDCQSWCRYAHQRFGSEIPMVLVGVSMGAATVLMASDLELPENVKAVVADCPYSAPKTIICKVAAEMGIPRKAAGVICSVGAFLYGKFRLNAASAVESVGRTKLPVLLIHGEDDDFVPYHMSQEIYEACASEKELHTFPNAGHGMSYLEDPQRYEAVVGKFLQRHLA